ncbi:MAG: OmpA family protein, partial [Gammaproteobacteria bacterium]|nr:OmpA family protein [Gammaproteobacteria bacterium]
AFDTDGDGVVDGIDMCANTPPGVAVDRVGCPFDSDKDGVEDHKDLCPATPLGTIVDRVGCPLPGQNILSLTGVNFDTNKAVLTAASKDILEQAVTLLKQTDAVIEVRVEGHTDSRGSEAYNMTLSQKRAEAVVAYLVSQGVNSSSLIPVGMGETSPVASNDTEAGRAANRRVDFVVSQ